MRGRCPEDGQHAEPDRDTLERRLLRLEEQIAELLRESRQG